MDYGKAALWDAEVSSFRKGNTKYSLILHANICHEICTEC